ncbi:hypothetical protein WMY93_007069 [Mugilogobius chulae]|uniref:RBR-type E3 ubiquitin transferase n=1 Tax=Mugilogobius chulae TaxID=88201 RepID=A0AAW0PQ26_9GOBI
MRGVEVPIAAPGLAAFLSCLSPVDCVLSVPGLCLCAHGPVAPFFSGYLCPFAKIRLLDVTTRLIRRSHHVLNTDGPPGALSPHTGPTPSSPIHHLTSSPGPIPLPDLSTHARDQLPGQGSPLSHPSPLSSRETSLHKHPALGGGMGSDRDIQSAASSISLPSVKKGPRRDGSHWPLCSDAEVESPNRPGNGPGISSKDREHSVQWMGSPASRASTLKCCDGFCWGSVHSSASGPSSTCSSASKAAGGTGAELLECPLCLLRHSRDCFPDIMTCHHRSCMDCLRQYLRIEISESRVNISCPECSERFNPHDIRLILGDKALMEKYEEFMLRRWLVADPDCRWCPAPDCGYAVIAFGCASCPKITCGRDGCGTEFCYHCKQLWHPNQTCDAARQQRAQSLRLRTVRSSSLSYSQESGAAADDIKPCPRCAAYIIKMNDGSCNHMTCAVCGCEFCWLCMKEISDLHYLSPSGCTFWGKKPWSRKKKILWQLGTLVGAPVGIALIAGIAIPAMIIGIPVYVGRKIHNRYEGKDMSNHKRNLVIAGGVTLSVIVSPVVAAVTVGIGVPIMLAYVYGVVPISLCRSGGCDMTSVANTRNNPSIGEGSVGGLTGSLSASGSHMDRLGARDNLSESASTTALAGASITGSLCGSAMVSYINRDGNSMEVQVDIESKPAKLRHHSGSSSVDDSGQIGRCGWTCPVSGCSDGKGTSSKWAKDAACSNSSNKKNKGKLRKKGGSTKINESREDMDAQLLEQRSTNSSEFDSPSLSGSLPSVADSHCSHFSEFSGSDLESMKTSCSHGSGGAGGDYHTRFATVSPLPEVENDRLETCPGASSVPGLGAFVTPHSPTSTSSSLGQGAELSPMCFITEENVNLVCPAESDSQSNNDEMLKEANNNQEQPQTQPQPKSSCIQTDI